MQLAPLDWGIIILFFAIFILIGLLVAKKSGKDSKSFFLSDRNMPWWLLGVSMVATTFAADTPNFVAGVIREDGVFGNWIWWSFLLTGMLTVFFYAKLWRKSGITTDLEFYELRYSGKSAAFLRGFRAIYLGIFFNIVIMANVCLAAIKIGHVMFGLSSIEVLLIASPVVVIYSAFGGLKGVLLTDFVQFIIAMVGSIWATIYIVNMPEIGGIKNLLSTPAVAAKTAMLPDFSKPELLVPLLIVPLAVQWWSVWYPGAEPGGGGYIAQRMLAAKDEKHATWATLFFNFAHYALRPWPWIIIGLASIIIFPNIESLQAAFPDLNPSFVKNDLSYPAMLTFLPAGLLGIVITSLIAAFMSTISTHLNWGSSYVVNDFYVRFIRKEANGKEQVAVGRISTVLMMVLAALLALILEEAREGFDLLLSIGAGTGLLFILRWFWSRINPYSEIAAMVISFLIAAFFFINGKMENPLVEMEGYWQLVLGVVVTTIGWVMVTLLTKPSNKQTLETFNNLIFGNQSKFKGFGMKILGFFAGVFGVYCALFSIGNFIYGNNLLATGLCAVTLLCGFLIIKSFKKTDL
ncbi:sodium:solute symporter family protein [Aequorivita echinoideorum]|uniref:Na+:solute symporter n=1 Tax=Aequorivita echinoideorum TaxID=1549647 RepID=A0ABS5S6A0_9FLAO|nr:sodium:solute symporter family protein [Aequorivita echinoideorum]MBT0608737.1 Na+:solute symporter [Aequorivita echinoideorum]